MRNYLQFRYPVLAVEDDPEPELTPPEDEVPVDADGEGHVAEHRLQPGGVFSIKASRHPARSSLGDYF